MAGDVEDGKIQIKDRHDAVFKTVQVIKKHQKELETLRKRHQKEKMAIQKSQCIAIDKICKVISSIHDND